MGAATFYMVMREKASSGYDNKPSKQYDNLQDAKAEAERLCRKEKAAFNVLEVVIVGTVRSSESPVVWE